MDNLYKSIVSDLKKHEDKEGAEYAKRWHKYENFKSYGILASVVRDIFKKHKKEIQALNCKDALDLA